MLHILTAARKMRKAKVIEIVLFKRFHDYLPIEMQNMYGSVLMSSSDVIFKTKREYAELLFNKLYLCNLLTVIFIILFQIKVLPLLLYFITSGKSNPTIQNKQ